MYLQIEKNSGIHLVHCFPNSLIKSRKYHHFTNSTANHCCQSLNQNYSVWSCNGGKLFSGVSAKERTKRASDGTPFADLSVAEMNGVIRYLSQQTIFNFAPISRAKMTDAIIVLIEAIRPPKEATLRYLDDSGPLPQRAARVVLQRWERSPGRHWLFELGITAKLQPPLFGQRTAPGIAISKFTAPSFHGCLRTAPWNQR